MSLIKFFIQQTNRIAGGKVSLFFIQVVDCILREIRCQILVHLIEFLHLFERLDLISHRIQVGITLWQLITIVRKILGNHLIHKQVLIEKLK